MGGQLPHCSVSLCSVVFHIRVPVATLWIPSRTESRKSVSLEHLQEMQEKRRSIFGIIETGNNGILVEGLGLRVVPRSLPDQPSTIRSSGHSRSIHSSQGDHHMAVEG